MKKMFLSILLRVTVSAGLISILLYIMRNQYGQILAVLKSTSIMIFALAFLTFLLAVSLASLRLKLIIKAQGADVTLLEALSLTFIAYFFNNFLPTAIGGDFVKAYYLSKKTRQTTASFTSVFIDRVLGLVTMIFMASLALFFVGNEIVEKPIRNAIYLITALAALSIFFLANKNFARRFSILLRLVKPLEEKLRNIYNTVHNYRHYKFLLFQSMGISILSQILFFSTLGILGLSIRSNILPAELLLRMPIVSAMSLLPSINGLGLREGSTVLLFGPLIGKENAFALSILWLFILFIMSLLGGLIYGLSPQFRVRFDAAKSERG